MKREKILDLISNMTLEEKASMCSGADFWHTKPVERVGIPSTMVSDGPHGLRKQDLESDHLGVNESIKAVCFPAGCALAASFDRELLKRLGETIGNECQAEGVSVILGPAVNIKRSPLCGRNFEYYSEDPYVATELAGGYIDGVQSKNVGVSIKHFLANNQETRRMTSSSEIDERTLHEIYLAAFEGAIREHKPWTVMCSYNRINGTYAAENKKYLTDTLRGEWGFDGYVMSDWGAMNDRVPDLKAGLDLEMPASGGVTDQEIVKAVREGQLSESVLDEAVFRILNIVYRYEENRDVTAVFDREADHKTAYEIAKETIVLLKNDGILPFAEDKKIAMIGKFAKSPRYQGGGSSHINSFKVISALEVVKENPNVTYAQGYIVEKDKEEKALVEEAVAAAKQAEAAVIFAGLPDNFESEGFDRTHMRLPDCQNRLIKEVAKVQPNVVVVLHNGSPVEMPWINEVKGVIEAYLGGEAIGEAICDILYGKANPCGKLPETFPEKLEDNPSYLYYIGERDKVEYKEGIFIGYRYYDAKKSKVLFPFGHGLSYTTFFYSNLKTDRESMKDTDTVTVSVDISNVGAREGKEIVQLYVGKRESKVIRPVKELRGFEKVSLKPGETKKVTFTLSKRAFAYFNAEHMEWEVESGQYEIMIARSSKEIELVKEIQIEATTRHTVHIDMNTTILDLMESEEAIKVLLEELHLSSVYDILGETQGGEEEDSVSLEAISKDMTKAVVEYLPLRGIVSFSEGKVTLEQMQHIINRMNELEQVAN